ncbi:MAG: hypothetical protein EAX96_09185 [Candidatus Lokiarchaeota archaeon]|nr:hypothetical protein [Candidatus Lokiarchaeota archaeon]
MYKAANLIKPKLIRIEERENLTPKKEEVIIKVTTAGICGTDIAIFSGNYPVSLPLVLGHEFSGKIIKVGDNSRKNLIGKRVTAEINNTCLSYKLKNKCISCSNGLNTHCLNRTVLGITQYDGAFAEQLKSPLNNIHLIPDDISDSKAIFIEPLAAAIQTFEMSPISKSDFIVVLGSGRLGILIIKVAKLFGGKVLAVSRSKEKLERAKKFGADYVLPFSENLIETIKELTNNFGADMIVECSGNSELINEAIKYVRPRGTIALKTTSGVPANYIDITKIVVEEIRVVGSRCGNFQKAIEMMQDKKFDVSTLISKKFKLEDIEKAMKSAESESKVLIEL